MVRSVRAGGPFFEGVLGVAFAVAVSCSGRKILLFRLHGTVLGHLVRVLGLSKVELVRRLTIRRRIYYYGIIHGQGVVCCYGSGGYLGIQIV